MTDRDTTAAPLEAVIIDGDTYTVRERSMPGSARRSHGGAVLDLVTADGSVAGTLTLRRSKRGWLRPVRTGIAKMLSEYNASKLLGVR